MFLATEMKERSVSLDSSSSMATITSPISMPPRAAALPASLNGPAAVTVDQATPLLAGPARARSSSAPR